MFLGVSLINTGSYALQLTMCYCTAVLIGTLAWIVADMDFVYVGYIKVTPGPFIDLLSVITTNPSLANVNKDLNPRLKYSESGENLLTTAHDYNRAKPPSKASLFFTSKLNGKSKVTQLHPEDKRQHDGLMRLTTSDFRQQPSDESLSDSGHHELYSSRRFNDSAESPVTSGRRALTSVRECESETVSSNSHNSDGGGDCVIDVEQ